MLSTSFPLILIKLLPVNRAVVSIGIEGAQPIRAAMNQTWPESKALQAVCSGGSYRCECRTPGSGRCPDFVSDS